MEEFSLCQPDKVKSCGACCGLYNYKAAGREDLIQRLTQRTERFNSIPRTMPAFREFSDWVKEVEPQDKLFQTIYNCEFLGFLDQDLRRVGCLLHPAQNNGTDFRSCSFYGEDLCAAHRCESYRKLSIEETQGVMHALEDWFLYGLCITDIDLVKGFFFHASQLLGERPDPRVLAHDMVSESLASFLVLKIRWPFRTQEQGRFGKYCFAEDEYREARIPYDRLGAARSPYDAILLSLASDFSSHEELNAAEQLISAGIQQFVDVYLRYAS